MTTKLCKDCKWCKRRWSDFGSYDFATCASPKRKSKVSNVDGKKVYEFLYCSSSRQYDCGDSAQWWEAK